MKTSFNIMNIPTGKKILLYGGAGQIGQGLHRFIDKHRPDLEIAAYVDDFKKDILNGIRIIHPDSLNKTEYKNALLIIASTYYEKLAENLKQKNIYDFEIVNPGLFNDTLYMIKDEIKEETEHLGYEEVKKHLSLGVQYVHGAEVKGDIAEFGTDTGKTASIIGSALSVFDGLSGNSGKKLLLFDSFKGWPDPENSMIDSDCPHVKSGIWNEGQCRTLNEEQLRDKIIKISRLPEERVVIYSGWFKDTLAEEVPADTRLAMLHVDCSFYESAFQLLDLCFQRRFISDGAVIFFNCWNCNRASKEFGEQRAWLETAEKYSIDYTPMGYYTWSGYKVLINGY